LRQGLAVEAGVEVVGSVAAPQVRLVSEPAVPDAEKLSWLVLGRGSDQLAGGDASLLMSAATAIFGGDGSRNIPRDIVQGWALMNSQLVLPDRIRRHMFRYRRWLAPLAPAVRPAVIRSLALEND
jgi:hypothetical protein